jgi:hypothetical protein
MAVVLEWRLGHEPPSLSLSISAAPAVTQH